jgi:bacterioferritin
MKVSKKLLGLLDKAIAREMQVSIQYMWQHVMGKGLESGPVRDTFKEIAIVEMEHAEAIAERLSLLGGVPTTKPDPITIGDTLTEMLELDAKAEEEAIELYREIIEVAENEKDYTTRNLFEGILADEEEHLDEFNNLLGK